MTPVQSRVARFVGTAAIAATLLASASALAQVTPPVEPAPAVETPVAPAPAAETPAPAAETPALTAEPDPATVVVATLNGEPITLADLDAMAADFGDALAQFQPAERTQALIDAVVNLRLMYAQAETMGLGETPAFLAQMEMLRQRALQNAYVQAAVADLITEEAIQARYDQEVAAMNLPEQVHARHILVNTEAEALDIINQLNGGADFATLAAQLSIDTGTGAQGGDLGWFAEGEMIQEFEDAAFAIEPGQVGQVPVPTQFGWHVIKVDERRRQPPPGYEENKELIRQIIFREAYLAEAERLRADADIQIMGAAPAAPALEPIPAPVTEPIAPAPTETPAPAPAAEPAPAPVPTP
ncbi:MAG: peptidylprolyl isomerase [Bauldia sp.]|nr:peptidylprolyl isomerase [Bauldia sp.]MCW5718955.1 peptidylprolyl isomerase [Bauldia sp.]